MQSLEPQGDVVTPSLTLILPVRNAQYIIARQIHRLLELAADLTDRFELLVIDDHSSDFTQEITREIAREFPQVRLHLQSGKGTADGLKLGQQIATGEIVLSLEQGKIVSAMELHSMWNLRLEAINVRKQSAKPMTISENLMERLGMWGKGAAAEAARRATLPSGSRRDESHANDAKSAPAVPSFINHLKNLIGGEESAKV